MYRRLTICERGKSVRHFSEEKYLRSCILSKISFCFPFKEILTSEIESEKQLRDKTKKLQYALVTKNSHSSVKAFPAHL